PDAELVPLVAAQLQKRGIEADERLEAICALFKDRCDTTVVLADWAAAFYTEVTPQQADLDKHLADAVRPAIAAFAGKLEQGEWSKEAIAAALKATLADFGLKMPALAMPVRVLVMGTPQTPSVDAVLFLQGREKVLMNLRKA
ncbi:MAG: glutamate--tRNA ligase GltX, partial [Pseudomonadota bacterium]